jgi:hypothetical protein
MCNQWERKGMCRHLLLWLVQFETRGKCQSFCCKDFILTFLNCGFMTMCTSTEQFRPSTVMTITCDKSGSADNWVMISRKVSGLVYIELPQSAVSSLATRRNLTDRHITELILQSVSDTHSSEDKDIAAQSESALGDVTDTNSTQCNDSTDSMTGYVTDTNSTQCTDSTHRGTTHQ